MLLVSHPLQAFCVPPAKRLADRGDSFSVFSIDRTLAIKFWHIGCDNGGLRAGRIGPSARGRAARQSENEGLSAPLCANFLLAASLVG